jgi:succinoglycan biosynthesis protein ExoM
MSDHPAILIGIITCKRPQMFEKLLDSLMRQTIFETDIRVACVVVDNDKDRGAEGIFNRTAVKMPCRMQYLLEERRGIPFARNRVLEYAASIQSAFIAFIDDDETADPEWLLTLYRIITSTGVDAVQGKVSSLLPGGDIKIPSWSRNAMRKENNKTEGALKRGLSTNNVLFSSTLVIEKGLRFDERFALTGGSDIDFFSRSADLGGRHIWTNRAVVYEEIPRSRLTLTWQFFRSFRVGATNTYMAVQKRGCLYAIKRYSLKIVARIFTGILVLLTAGIVSGRLRLLAVQWIGSGVGHLLGFWGILGSEYHRIHGN